MSLGQQCYLLLVVDVFDYGGVGVIHPDTPDVCRSECKVHQGLLYRETDVRGLVVIQDRLKYSKKKKSPSN